MGGVGGRGLRETTLISSRSSQQLNIDLCKASAAALKIL